MPSETGFMRPETTVSAATTRQAERGPAKVEAVTIKREGNGFVAICQKSDGTSTPYQAPSLDAAVDYTKAEFGESAAPAAEAPVAAPAPVVPQPGPAARPKNTSVY